MTLKNAFLVLIIIVLKEILARIILLIAHASLAQSLMIPYHVLLAYQANIWIKLMNVNLVKAIV